MKNVNTFYFVRNLTSARSQYLWVTKLNILSLSLSISVSLETINSSLSENSFSHSRLVKKSFHHSVAFPIRRNSSEKKLKGQWTGPKQHEKFLSNIKFQFSLHRVFSSVIAPTHELCFTFVFSNVDFKLSQIFISSLSCRISRSNALYFFFCI